MKYFTLLIITFFSQVGIGTALPESSLDVRATNHLGSVSASDGVLVPRVNDLSTAGATDGQLVYLTADVSTFTKGFHYLDDTLSAWTPINSTIEPWNRAGTNDPATLNTDNIYTQGQVGIGTDNPLGALHITTENSRDVLLFRFLDAPSDDLDIDLFRSQGTLAAPSFLQDDTRIGGLRGQAITKITPTYIFGPSAEIYFQADEASSATSSAGKIKFATTPSGTTSTVDRMVIRESGFIGIGADDPVEHIEIKRAGDNDMQFTSASTNPPNIIFYNTGGSLDSPGLLATNQEIGSVLFKTNNGSSIREVGGIRMFMDGTPTASSLPTKLVFNTTPAGAQEQILDPAAMTIDNAGMVGIGVNDPQAKLDILGNVKIVDGTQGANKVLTSDANGVASWEANASVTEGDVKNGFQSTDHNGWYLLDGRAISTLPANAQAAATSLGFSGNLPNANNRVLKAKTGTEALGSQAGSNAVTLIPANVPQITGVTNTTGAHTHDYTRTANVNALGFDRQSDTDAITTIILGNFSTQSSGNHNHAVTVGNAAPSAVNTTPASIVTNVFVYLGNW